MSSTFIVYYINPEYLTHLLFLPHILSSHIPFISGWFFLWLYVIYSFVSTTPFCEMCVSYIILLAKFDNRIFHKCETFYCSRAIARSLVHHKSMNVLYMLLVFILSSIYLMESSCCGVLSNFKQCRAIYALRPMI